jgi:hypothetical protein
VPKKTSKIQRKAKRLGEHFSPDKKRKDGGLIYKVWAIRDRVRRMGKLGPASGVRRIDPVTGDVIEEISLKQIEAAKTKTPPRKSRRRRSQFSNTDPTACDKK